MRSSDMHQSHHTALGKCENVAHQTMVHTNSQCHIASTP